MLFRFDILADSRLHYITINAFLLVQWCHAGNFKSVGKDTIMLSSERAINGVDTSALDFKTIVGMQSIGDDLAGIASINFRTSSIDGARSENSENWATLHTGSDRTY